MSQIQQVFMYDGKTFETKAQVEAYIREPKIKEALMTLTQKNTDLVNWLMANREDIAGTFDSGKIARVTKSERKQLAKALDAVADVKGAEFLKINAKAVLDSFRWPSVKRGTPEEQAAALQKSFMDMTENNTDLVAWIISSKDALLEAFEAGVEKRQVSPAASQALAEYRARKQAEKEAKEKAEKEATAS
jgi:hypothetical protein